MKKFILMWFMLLQSVVGFTGGVGSLPTTDDRVLPGLDGNQFIWNWGQLIAGENWKVIGEVEKIEGFKLAEQIEVQQARYVGTQSLFAGAEALNALVGIEATNIDQDEVEVKVKTLNDEFKFRSFTQEFNAEQLELMYKSYENGTTLILGQ